MILIYQVLFLKFSKNHMTTLEEIAKAEKVLILGFAREGQSTYRFLRQEFPNLKIGCADKTTPSELPVDQNTNFHFGSDYLEQLLEYSLVVKSAGIPPHIPEIEVAKESGVNFTSHTQLFFEKCQSRRIIGITGTKGKSTTATLVHHILEVANQKPVLVGNIGIPALDSLKDITQNTSVVFELSSFQLSDLKHSPDIAVLLPIFQDHLDYHNDMEEYRNAKLNITKYQSAEDILVCYASHENIRTNARTVTFTESDLPSYIKSSLIGEHNKINIATIPEATIAAIDAMKPYTLIAGGHERGQDYKKLAEKIIESSVEVLILFPTTGSRIKSEVDSMLKHGEREVVSVAVDSMEDAVKYAYKLTPQNKTCLLSPAAPSFSIFKDYKDEAEQFHNCVKKFGKDALKWR